jgi:carbonic anhydrase
MPAPVVTPQRTQQSPIKLSTRASYYVPDLRPLAFDYTKVSGTLEGEELVLDHSGPTAHVEFDGMRCPLRKLHFHAPAEHRIDGRIAELELHLVHEIPAYPEGYPSAYLIIAVMLAPEAPNLDGADRSANALGPWLRGHFDATAVASPRRLGGQRAYEVDPSLYLPKNQFFFRYEGSRTYGDFDELVTWIVMYDTKPIMGPGPLKIDPEASRLVQPLMRRYVLRNFALIA